MKRNIILAYILAFCKNAWFWLGIWVFYYLKGTNYAGMGIIETVMIATMTITEIPTGAIADIFGKKNTLIISYFLLGAGNIIMGLSFDFWVLVASVFVSAVGVSLGSGTLEALVYDSLKQENKEITYDKKIANINTIQLVAIAICGAGGGFLYQINPSLPFYVTGIFYVVGMIVCLFLSEPIIDSVMFSVKNYLGQMSQGLKQLYKTRLNINTTWILWLIGSVVVITDEMLNSVLGVEFGYTAQVLGIFWAGIFLVSALVTQTIPTIKRLMSEQLAIFLTGTAIALSLLVSPWLGLIAGGVTLVVRNSLQSIYYGLSSIAINNMTESKYRATTLSTFNMVKNMPYVVGAYFFGSLADKFSAKTTAGYLGLTMILGLIIWKWYSARTTTATTSATAATSGKTTG